MNKAMLIGRLGQDPKLAYTQSNTAVCQMSVATDESYTDRNGNKVDQTEWHRVVLFNRTAENANKYLKKGSQVFVEGKLRTRKYQDKNGTEKYTTEILAERLQFLDSKPDQQQQTQPQQAQPQQQEYDPLAMDEVPF